MSFIFRYYMKDFGGLWRRKEGATWWISRRSSSLGRDESGCVEVQAKLDGLCAYVGRKSGAAEQAGGARRRDHLASAANTGFPSDESGDLLLYSLHFPTRPLPPYSVVHTSIVPPPASFLILKSCHPSKLCRPSTLHRVIFNPRFRDSRPRQKVSFSWLAINSAVNLDFTHTFMNSLLLTRLLAVFSVLEPCIK